MTPNSFSFSVIYSGEISTIQETGKKVVLKGGKKNQPCNCCDVNEPNQEINNIVENFPLRTSHKALIL